MGDADVTTTQWRLVEVGRIVLFARGPYSGKLAAVAEIIDHKRVLVDGPASTPEKTVPRHEARLADVTLSPILIPKVPRAARSGVLKAAWEKHEVEKKWENSSWAKRKQQMERRRQLTDFERFKVMRLKKQSRFEVKRTLAKIRAKA